MLFGADCLGTTVLCTSLRSAQVASVPYVRFYRAPPLHSIVPTFLRLVFTHNPLLQSPVVRSVIAHTNALLPPILNHVSFTTVLTALRSVVTLGRSLIVPVHAKDCH